MPEPVATLLLIGDVHLGRRPRPVPDGMDGLGPAAALRAAVALALERRVDAVLFAGDVVESIDDRFEALPVIEAAVRDLERAGIPAVAVAGNHDVAALPRLAKLTAGLRLLGAAGSWEHADVAMRGGGALRIVGRSFARRFETADPLASFDAAAHASDAFATVGLLHGDLDAPSSKHAPIRRALLEAAPVDAWFLGHIHKPDPAGLAAARPIGYLGSLCGLDVGETGARGAWLARVFGKRRFELEHVPLAPLRWERVDVDAAAVAGDDEPALALEDAIVAALRARAAAIAAELADGTRAVGCRVVLRGRSPRHRELRAALAGQREALREIRTDAGGVIFYVESIADAARPELDLRELAQSADPPGILARLLVAIKEGEASAAGRELVEAAAKRFAKVAAGSSFAALDADGALSGARERLLAAGARVLEDLLAERVAAGAAAERAP